MAALTQVSATTSDRAVNLTRLALGASDTLTYVSGANQYVGMYNTTASPVVVAFTGTAPTTLTIQGYGGDVSTSGGKAITVPASGFTLLNLDDIGAFLTGTGTVTVTGGTGVTAVLFV